MTFLYIVVALVLIFDFINGFHDSANSIATVVSTKVLSPVAAVSMAAFFNFIAFLIFPLKVATTMGKGVINPDVINLTVIASALVAAITWNLVTWWFGLPSSSSHTLVGGLSWSSCCKFRMEFCSICRSNKNCNFYCDSSGAWNGYVIYYLSHCDLSLQGIILLPGLINISEDCSFYLLQHSVWVMVEMMPRSQWELSGLL